MAKKSEKAAKKNFFWKFFFRKSGLKQLNNVSTKKYFSKTEKNFKILESEKKRKSEKNVHVYVFFLAEYTENSLFQSYQKYTNSRNTGS